MVGIGFCINTSSTIFGTTNFEKVKHINTRINNVGRKSSKENKYGSCDKFYIRKQFRSSSSYNHLNLTNQNFDSNFDILDGENKELKLNLCEAPEIKNN